MLKDRMRPAVLAGKAPVGGQEGLAIFTFRHEDESPIFPFQAGQYGYLGLETGGRFLNRLYSISSSPSRRDAVEFYAVHVDGGEFTTPLFALEVGGRAWLMGPGGKFTLDRTRRSDLVLVATGTGLGPFLSMIRKLSEETRPGGPPRVTLFEGVRHARDLGYEEELRALEKGPLDLVYVPTVSRRDEDLSGRGDLGRGRANDLLRLLLGEQRSGTVDPVLPRGRRPEELLDRMRPDRAAFFLCGNPGMIRDLRELLPRKGYAEAHTEEYWK